MIIALVTEFAQDEYFQWRQAWTIERQLKYHVMVKSVEVSPATLYWYGGNIDHPNWYWLRKADVIFCYCSRTSIDMYHEGQKWWWFNLPNYIRKIKSPTAKLIVQWDDDLIFLNHPDWVWWNRRDKPIEYEGEIGRFARETKLFEIADMYFSVLPNPEFAAYTSKPVKKMLLPQLERVNRGYKEGYSFNHASCVAMMHHSSKACSNNHTIKNVISKVGCVVRYFTAASNTQVDPLPSGSKYVPMKGCDVYLRYMNEQCKVAIDDAEGYMGWSRFVMECALTKIPCISSFSSGKDIFPDLATEHKDYNRQIELLKKLLNDDEFRVEQAKQGYENVMKKLDSDVLIQTFLDYVKSLNPTEYNFTKEEFDAELLIQQLNKILPFHIIPTRPAEGASTFDHLHAVIVDSKKWDEFYGNFAYLILDERKYKSIIRTALERKNQKATSQGEFHF